MAAMVITTALLGSLLVVAPAQALSDTGSGGVFVPATGRLLDTANNIGGYNTPMPVKTWRTITVGGVAGIPNDGSVGAVSLVATVANIPAQGLLNGRPNEDVKATTMGIYGGANKQNTSFASVVAVNDDGTIQVQAETAVRLILDVQGYYTADSDGAAPGGFVAVSGEHILDTRSGLGTPKATLAPGQSIDVQVTGKAGIPAGASAAVVNLIALNTTSAVGYLTPYATGSTRPTNSFNYAGSVTTSMSAQVKLSAAGKMTIYNANSTTNVVVDVQGYFTAAEKGGSVFTPGSGRVYDTRVAGNTVFAKNETRSIQVAGVSGIPVMGSGVSAVILTLTSLKSTSGGGFATAWADGTTRPNTTSINFDETTIRTNTITVPLGANGKISLNNVADPTNYAIDIQGWYVNALAPLISCPEPYILGSWTKNIPIGGITCNVSARESTEKDAYLTVTIDGQTSEEVELSGVAATNLSVAVPGVGGSHLIEASVSSPSVASAQSSYGFALGDWARAALAPSPSNGGSTYVGQAGVQVEPVNDQFGDDVTISYTVSSNSDGVTAPIASSTNAANGLSIPKEKLVAGNQYYWKATIAGKSGGSSTASSVSTPIWSFRAVNTVTTIEGAQLDASVALDAVRPIGQDEAAFDENKNLTDDEIAVRSAAIQSNYSSGDTFSVIDLEFLKLYKFGSEQTLSSQSSASTFGVQSTSTTQDWTGSGTKKFDVTKNTDGRKVKVKGSISGKIGIIHNSYNCDFTTTRLSGKTTNIRNSCEIKAYGAKKDFPYVGLAYSASPSIWSNSSPYHFQRNAQYDTVVLSWSMYYNVKVQHSNGSFTING